MRPWWRSGLPVCLLLLVPLILLPGCASVRALRTPLPLPPPGSLYHGVFPGPTNGREDGVTPEDLASYESAVGRRAAWVYFSSDWFRSREFPEETARWIRDRGSIPFIRLMLRSDERLWHAESTFTLQRIIEGAFDGELRAWARAARSFGSPLLVEYGTEVNCEWFSWNAVWNGAGDTVSYGDPHLTDGPERFLGAYRHIVGLFRDEGAKNITWVWHVNNGDAPSTEWNRLEKYYPGDSWVDWVGVSVYGAQKPTEAAWPQFSDLMDGVYQRLRALAPTKPVIVCEFGATSGNPLGDQSAWAEAAIDALVDGRWPAVIGFAWWNGRWKNDTKPQNNTDMRVQDNQQLGESFRRALARDGRIKERIR